jgi:hypothetical protein
MQVSRLLVPPALEKDIFTGVVSFRASFPHPWQSILLIVRYSFNFRVVLRIFGSKRGNAFEGAIGRVDELAA